MRTTRVLGILIALALLLSAVPASAESSFSERLHAQMNQIDDSIKSGHISYSQARWLKRQHRTVRIQAEVYANRSNITGAERARLNTYLSELEDTLALYVAMNENDQPDGLAVTQN
jgi:hypothetical protein